MSNLTPTPLTKKEMMILEFIEGFFSNQGTAPSFQEIKDHFGFKSFFSVQRYLKQLQRKNYLHMPGGNQKRAMMLLHSSSAVKSSLDDLEINKNNAVSTNGTKGHLRNLPESDSLSLPLLGRVAAGAPIEAFDFDEYLDVPLSLVRNPSKSFALKVEGQSMIGEGIFDGDLIIVQEQSSASNGEIIVAEVDNESTVKRFYLHKDKNLAQPQVELRPANPEMESMWYSPDEVRIKGILVGLIRHY